MKTSNRIIKIGILSLFLVQLFSCDSAVVFEENHDFGEQQWNKDSVITFSFQADTIYAEEIRFAINLRNTVDYSYRNLWLFMELETPDHSKKRDTLNLFLMNEQGYWLDNVKGGRIKESKHLYPYKLAKPQSGLYKISLQHAMRVENLKEIVSIGTRIEKIQ